MIYRVLVMFFIRNHNCGVFLKGVIFISPRSLNLFIIFRLSMFKWSIGHLQGSKGLSLYYVETKSQDPNSHSPWNNISIVTLKDKLGTRQLPTAEIILDGTHAMKLSDDGRGISSISGMLTITRIHNAIAAVASMRRITMLAVEYAKNRTAFGSKLIDKPLHASTLAMMDVESRAAFYFLMDTVQLLGLQENMMDNEEETDCLRVFSPLLKLYTAKQAMSVISEGLECFGGQGYIESTGLPGMLRDAQVLPIWEGTTNILSLDALRALGMESKSSTPESKYFQHVIARSKRKINNSDQKQFPEYCESLSTALKVWERFIISNAHNTDLLSLHARHLSYSISRIYMGTLLLEVASFPEATQSDRMSLQYWMKKNLVFGLTDLRPSGISWKTFFD